MSSALDAPQSGELELDADIAALLNQAFLLSDEPLKQKMADAQDRMKGAEHAKKAAEAAKSALEESNFESGDLFDARAMYIWIKDEAKSHGKSLPLDFSSTGEKTLQLFTALNALEQRLQSGKPSENASEDVKASYERGATAARDAIMSGSRPIVQMFFRQMKSVARDVFGKSIEQAELNRLSALSDTEEGQRLAEKHGLHIKVKAAKDSLETSKEVFERDIVKMLMRGPEFLDNERKIHGVCHYFQVKTLRDLDMPSIQNRYARARASQWDRGSYDEKNEFTHLAQALEVHVTYPLLEYEKAVILPALARMYADRIMAHASATYPNDIAKQRLFLEASKKSVCHPFFDKSRSADEEPRQYIGENRHDTVSQRLHAGNRPQYVFSTVPQSAGLTSEDQDFLNGEWLRARALRGVLLSSRAVVANNDSHKSQNDVYGGIAAVDQYLGYRGSRYIIADKKDSFLGGKGYFSIHDKNHASPTAVSHELYTDRYDADKGRNDTKTLTETDPTFAHDVMAIQAMEKQVLQGLPEEEQKMFHNYDWTPVFIPLFDYTAPDGTIYASGKREEQQAHFNQMKAFLASFDRGGENASLQERRRIATIEDATVLTEEYRLRALGAVTELEKAQGQLGDLNRSLATEQGSTRGAHEKAQTLAQRIEQLQAELQMAKSGNERAERELAALQESSRTRNDQAQSQIGQLQGQVRSLEVQGGTERDRIAAVKGVALNLVQSMENSSGVLDGKKRADYLATLKRKLTEL